MKQELENYSFDDNLTYNLLDSYELSKTSYKQTKLIWQLLNKKVAKHNAKY